MDPARRSARLQIPVLGPALETLALARLAWVDAPDDEHGHGRSPGDPAESRKHEPCPISRPYPRDRPLDRHGGSIDEAFAEAGGYPADFLDALHVGEESGQLVESMGHLSRAVRGSGTARHWPRS